MKIGRKILKRIIKKVDPFQSRVGVKGLCHLQLFGPDGKLKTERFVQNIVVNTGLTHIADQMAVSNTDTLMTHMAVGTSGGTPGAGNTDIGTIVGARLVLTGSTPTHSSGVVTYTCTFSAGVSTAALTEAGIFNALTLGTMLCRTVYDVINKLAADSLAITWTLTFTDDGVA